MMWPVAKAMTDGEIGNVAAFLTTL
jgi:hypothetical protein